MAESHSRQDDERASVAGAECGGSATPSSNSQTMAGTTSSTDDGPPEGDFFINPADGLPNSHPSLPLEMQASSDDDEEPAPVDADSFDDLPTSIIVTNIHSEVFKDDALKAEMEELFNAFSDKVTFQWLRSFKRLRVNFDTAVSAANARIHLHQFEYRKSVISCYFAQPVTPVSNLNLQLPALTKQFLISPPASPPAGWEPREENEPLVNHDLLAALANLTPGECHEIHPPTNSHPGIVVHTANLSATDSGLDEGASASSVVGTDGGNATHFGKIKVVPTKCPDRNPPPESN